MVSEPWQEEYYAAFRAANPGKKVPTILPGVRGWYFIDSTGTGKRRSQIEQMTARLRDRVASKEPSDEA